MRHITPVILAVSALLLIGGCASQPQPSTQPSVADQGPPASAIAQDSSDEAVAAALVFDPALIIGEPPVMLAREDRQPGAFVGYQEQTVTSFYIRIDDRQTGNRHNDRYERRAIIEQVGATYR